MWLSFTAKQFHLSRFLKFSAHIGREGKPHVCLILSLQLILPLTPLGCRNHLLWPSQEKTPLSHVNLLWRLRDSQYPSNISM